MCSIYHTQLHHMKGKAIVNYMQYQQHWCCQCSTKGRAFNGLSISCIKYQILKISYGTCQVGHISLFINSFDIVIIDTNKLEVGQDLRCVCVCCACVCLCNRFLPYLLGTSEWQ